VHPSIEALSPCTPKGWPLGAQEALPKLKRARPRTLAGSPPCSEAAGGWALACTGLWRMRIPARRAIACMGVCPRLHAMIPKTLAPSRARVCAHMHTHTCRAMQPPAASSQQQPQQQPQQEHEKRLKFGA